MSKTDRKNGFLIGSSILSFLLIVLSLFTAISDPCNGYELSIYSHTNIIYWVCAIYLSIHVAVLTMVTNTNKYLLVSILELLFLHIMLLSLFVIRGYVYLERADTLSYIGMAQDIGIINAVPEYNYYPVYSILMYLLSAIGGLQILTVAQYLPTILSLFSTVSILCCARAVNKDQLYLRCVLLCLIPITFAWYSLTVFHMTLATLMLPIILLIIARVQDIKYCLIIYPFLIMIIFGHPLVALMLLLILFSITVTRTVIEKSIYSRGLHIILLFGVIIAFWYVPKSHLMKHFGNIIEFIFGNIQLTSSAADGISLLNKTDLLTAFRAIIFMISDEILWTCVIVILFVFILSKKFTLDNGGGRMVFDLTVSFIVCNIAMVVSFILFDLHTPYRLINLNPIFIFAPILGGYLLYSIYDARLYRRIMTVAIILVSIISIFGLYMSPITNLPTDQVTAAELSGVKWLEDYKDDNIRIMDEKTPFFRFVDMQYGYDYKIGRTDLSRDYTIPDHFGIDSGMMVVDQTRYLFVSSYVVQAYSTIWENVGRFTEKDFQAISSCRNVVLNYNSNGAQIYITYI